jgi:hypothetical protein
MPQNLETPEEVEDYLINEHSGGGQAKRFEVAKKLLEGDIILLNENQIGNHFRPNGLTEEDIDNLTDIEYLLEEFGPLERKDLRELNAFNNESLYSGRQRNIRRFRPSSRGGGGEGHEGEFKPGVNNHSILFNGSEYEERVLQAYSNANDLELGPGKSNGTSWALKQVAGLGSNSNNWLRYRDPLGWSTKRKEKVEELYENGLESEKIAERIDSSLRYVSKIIEAE